MLSSDVQQIMNNMRCTLLMSMLESETTPCDQLRSMHKTCVQTSVAGRPLVTIVADLCDRLNGAVSIFAWLGYLGNR